MCHREVAGDPPSALRPALRVALAADGGDEMPGLLTIPETGQGPGILLLTDVYGPSPFSARFSQRLAARGFTVLVPDVFFREGGLESGTDREAARRWRRLDEERTLRDLSAAAGWLAAAPANSASRVSTVGFCLGGTLALDLAARGLGLATAVFYGFPAGTPYAAVNAPAPLSLVDAISGPLIGFWGRDDAGIDPADVARLGRELAARGQDCRFTVLEEVGHAFMAGQSPAAEQAWEDLLEFLHRAADTPPPAGR